MSFFGVNVTNPFTSAVGQKIEQATDANLSSENWALNMEICDIINETEDGPRDAIRAFRKRLNQAAGKNYTIIMYTLVVLETCVKNCGKRFHALACSREFVHELVKLIGPKNEPPTVVQEKVLNLIQTWADTFRNYSHTQGVVQVYQELKAKGIEFPMTDLDAMAPIMTPERRVPEHDTSPVAGAVGGAISADDPAPGNPQLQQQQQKQWTCASRAAAAGGGGGGGGGEPGLCQLTEQQMTKLRSELEIVLGNMRVFSEMLVAHSGGAAAAAAAGLAGAVADKPSERAIAEDLELLAELHSTCKAMQERVVYLIPKLAHPELTAELLQINDEMNNLFMRYARLTKSKHQVPASALVAEAIGATTAMAGGCGGAAAAVASGGPSSSSSSSAAAKKKLEAADSLIDLSDDEADAQGASARVMNLMEKRIADVDIGGTDGKSIRKDGEKDEFDAFAQSRTASFEAAKNSQESRGTEDEAGACALSTKNLTQTDKSLTSSEFERFLAERTAAAALEVSSGQVGAAAAAAAAPSSAAAAAGGSSSSSSNAMGTTLQRQIDKDAEDKSLFAL